ncbi:bola protein [Geopyxis carbonaria]|nr:bola protein [Geopyxis carbonaria]
MTTPLTPMEDAIRTKLTASLAPTLLQIHNDSHKHAHHKAMAGVASKETHFRVVVASAQFAGLRMLQRHRLVNGLLKDELEADGGIHALQLRTLTVEEQEKLVERAGEIEAKESARQAAAAAESAAGKS